VTRTRRRGGLLASAAVVAALASGLVATTPATTDAISLLAVPDTLTIVHDHTTTVPAPGVLANDIKLLGTTAVLNSQPSHGSVTLASNGGYTYDPAAGFVGTDVFRYHDFDGLLPTNTTTVTITVTNSAPVARDDRESANAGRKETVSAPGVLENDDDANGDPLQAKLVAGPTHGTLTFRANGSFDYTADSGFDGDDVFTYLATDGIANSAPADVVMNVSASGSTPNPSVGPSPTPPPTPRPTPSPTPAPTLTLPPLPTLTLPPLPTVTLPPLPLPTPAPGATGTPPPSGSARPSPRPSDDPGASTTPIGPDASGAPGTGGGSGGGAIGPGGPGGPGEAPGGGSGSGEGSSGGTDADGPVFSIGGDGPAAVVPLVGAEFAGFDSIDWAVPALTLTVPGLLLMLAVLAQLSAGAIWLPVVRRWLGAFGLGRRRRRQRPA
jgi:hypothetical protein